MVYRIILILSVIACFSDLAQADESEYGDWVLHCSNNDETCYISQIAVIEKTGETLMEFNIPLNKSGSVEGSKLEVILPLGTSLRIAPKLHIANQFISELKVSVCLPDGCYYSLEMSQALFERFLGMFSGYVKIQGPNGSEVDVPISGTGTRSAFNAFNEIYRTIDQSTAN